MLQNKDYTAPNQFRSLKIIKFVQFRINLEGILLVIIPNWADIEPHTLICFISFFNSNISLLKLESSCWSSWH